MDVLRPVLISRQSSTIILTGKPEIAKTMFSYQVYRSLLRRRKTSNMIVAYFTFDSQDYRRRSATSMLCSIIHQILASEPDTLDAAGPLQTNTLDWTEGNMWVWLRSLIRRLKSHTLVLIVDSINDCDLCEKEETLHNLLRLCFIRSEGFKLVCTTETIPTVHDVPSPIIVNLDALDCFKAALQASISDELNRIVSESPKFEAVEDIVSTCLSQSKDLLHLDLVAHRIRTITSESQPGILREHLSLLAVDLKHMIFGIMNGSETWVPLAISWMLFARRPLRPSELAVAVALLQSSEFDDIETLSIPRDIIGDLIRQLGPLVDTENEEIRIRHPYTRNVLYDWVNSAQAGCPSSGVLTRLCLEYLHMCLKYKAKEWPNIGARIDFQLFDYVLEYWHIHYAESMNDPERLGTPGSSHCGTLHELAYSLLTNPDYQSSLYSACPLPCGASEMEFDAFGPVYIATQLGLFDIVKRMAPELMTDNITTLQIACQYGHPNIVTYIIHTVDNVTDVKAELDRACLRGASAIFTTLLERLKILSPGNEVPGYLLVTACKMGSTAIVKTLLEAGVDPKGDHGLLAFEQAVDQGYIEIVSLLLEHGADVNASLSGKCSLLQRSIHMGYSNISQRLLLERGIRDDPDSTGITALHLAARFGNSRLVKRIINLPSRASDNQTGISSPLHEAAAGGHAKVVKVLLDSNADINAVDANGKTALFLALSKDHRDVVSELFSRQAIVPVNSEYSTSALKEAIIHGNLEATEKLLQLGADVQGGSGTETPLIDAAKRDFVDIASVLLMSGADFSKEVDFQPSFDILNEPAHLGWTAVHFAAYHGSVRVLHKFAELHHASIYARTKANHAPLNLAVFNKRRDVVDLIIQHRLSNRSTIHPLRPQSSNDTLSDRPTGTPPDDNAPRPNIPNIDVQTTKGRTPLHIAATNSNNKIVQLLIMAGAYVHAPDDDGKTPLHFSVRSPSSRKAMQCLLNAGSSLDMADKSGYTALYHAACAGNTTAVDVLLRAGSIPDGIPVATQTPLYAAARRGYTKVVRCLLNSGADPNSSNQRGYSALHGTCYNGYVEVVDLLLKHGANVNLLNSRRNAPLHEAADGGQKVIVERLLRNGAKINAIGANNDTPLQRSILSKHFATAKHLLERGANPNIPNISGNAALMVALLVSADEELINTLLDSGSDINTVNESHVTPLMQAAISSPRDISKLLERGAEMLTCGSDGITVFHIMAVVRYSTIDDISGLLQHSEYLNIKDAEGLTPVHHSARHQNAMMIKTLRKYGANLGERDRQGRTLMHHAVREFPIDEFKDAFWDFLQPGPGNKINVADDDGWTPLHWACKGASEEIARLLLSGNVLDQIHTRCKRGWTPWNIALFHEQDHLLDMMEEVMGTRMPIYAVDTLGNPEPAFYIHEVEMTERMGTCLYGHMAFSTTHRYARCEDCLYTVSCSSLRNID